MEVLITVKMGVKLQTFKFTYNQAIKTDSQIKRTQADHK